MRPNIKLIKVKKVDNTYALDSFGRLYRLSTGTRITGSKKGVYHIALKGVYDKYTLN